MDSTILLSILIAVAALLFVVAYLLVQFITERAPRAEAGGDGVSDGAKPPPKPKRAEPRPSRRYRRAAAEPRDGSRKRVAR